jgi:hypothetical protein
MLRFYVRIFIYTNAYVCTVILIPKRAKKGDPKSILEFLKTHEPLSEEDAKSLTKASEEARKNTTARKFDSTDS